MSKNRSGEDSPDFADEETASAVRTTQEAKDSLNYMADADRHLAFLTIASIAESGMSLPEAGFRLADEYAAVRKLKEARALKRFFKAVSAAMADNDAVDIIGECRESFGKTFVSVEEVLVLSRLHVSAFPAATLRDAAAIIAHKMEAALRAAKFRG